MMQQSDNVPAMKPTKPFRYAIGMFGTSIPINMFKVYAAIFYVDMLGVKATQYALILTIYTVLDAIDNPVYGYLSDCTRTRWGRRRPWLLIGTPLLVLCFIMFYNVPSFIGPGSVFWYMLVMYMLTGTLDSLINANYGALVPELFKGDVVRAKTNALRQAFQFVAMIISIALTPMVTGAIGYKMTAIVYSALALVVIVYMTLGCHEDPEAMNRPKPKLFQSIWQIIKNPYFWTYGMTNAIYLSGLGILMQAVPFYVKYTLNLDGIYATIMQGVVLVIIIGTIPVWVQVLKRIGLMKTWRISLFIIAFSFIPLYFAKNLIFATLVLVIFALGTAGSAVTMDIVGARILDEDTARHGVNREGVFSSFMGILNKTGNLFTALAFTLATSLYGYVSGDQPGPVPGDAARFLMVVFPFAMMLLAALLSFLLRFKDQPKKPDPVALEIDAE